MKVLVASDGSKYSIRGLKAAIKLAHDLRTKDSTITLINVHDDAGLRHAKSLVGKESVAEYLNALSEEEVAPSRKLLKSADIEYDIKLKTGHIAQTIIDFSEKEKFDLLVIGSKGRGAIADFLLGSVAQRIIATSTRTVLVVK